jgi:hypothetical protein
MTQKYIALFAASAEGKHAAEEEERHLTLPQHLHSTPAAEDKPAVTRLELLNKLKALMEDKTEAGKQGVSLRPEETLKEDGSGRTNKSLLSVDSKEKQVAGPVDKPGDDEEEEEEADDFFE